MKTVAVSDKITLKSCPFCGGVAYLNHEFTSIEKSYVQCGKCGIKGQSFGKAFDYASDDRAIEAWNRRVEDAEVH